MSLTISGPTSPQGWIPSGNDIIYNIISTQAGQAGFAYMIDVQVNNSSVIKLRQSPITPTTPIKLNVKDIVNNFISSTIHHPNINGGVNLYFAPPEYAEVTITVTERYAGDDWDSETTYPIYVWNSAAQFQDLKKGADLFYRKFVPHTQGQNTTIGRPLAYHNVIPYTSPLRQSGRRVYLGDLTLFKEYAYPMNEGIGRTISFMTYNSNYSPALFGAYFVFAGFDEHGKMIKKFVHPTNADSTPSKRIDTTICGVTQLLGGNFTYRYGADTTDMSDCAYVMFYVTNSFNSDYTTADTKFTLYPVLFEIGHCKESFAVLYKSNEGGWNVIQCNHKAKEETDIKTTTKLNVSPYTYDYSTRLISSVDVKAQGTIKVNTGWVNTGIQEDIQDMLTSPLIYIEHYKDGNVDYIPVTLSDSTYTTKETRNVDLVNYEFTFVESYYKNVIRQ